MQNKKQKKGTIRIKLKSDLSVASGYSYAGLVDSDICYDDYGIPFIPGRRLKGCFRNVAESVLYMCLSEEQIADLFGSWGSNRVQGIQIGNAVLDHYEELQEEAKSLIVQKKLTPQNILDQFTHIQSQTRLENGVAVDTSLRYTRVVDHYSPLSHGKQEEMVFYAPVSFWDSDENEIESILGKVVKATRNIGLKKNRGNGWISCELEMNAKASGCDYSNVVGDEKESDDSYMELCYVMKNIDPLMISDSDSSRTKPYIPGQNIIGVLANEYLKLPGASAESIEFQDLFLNEKTCYTNAYPYWAGREYYPAPLYINQLKKTKEIVNTLYECQKDFQSTEQAGNQPKKLKGKFCACDENGKMDIHEMNLRSIYHHSSRDEEKDVLYKFHAISEGQQFFGKIYVPQKYAALLKELLTRSQLFFGKSKSAEYGLCMLTDEVRVREYQAETLHCKKGEKLVVTLLSDAIFADPQDYTTDLVAIKNQVAAKLGIAYSGKSNRNDESDYVTDMIELAQIHGYNSMWNLRRIPVPAYKAGSTLIFTIAEDCKVCNLPIGERNQEGYGQISLKKYADMSYLVGIMEYENRVTVPIRRMAPVLHAVELEQCENSIKMKFIREGGLLKISKSQIGRVTSMLEEAYQKKREGFLCDFKKRVESIKEIKVQSVVVTNVLQKIADKDQMKSANEICDMGNLKLSEAENASILYQAMRTWLTYQKYMTKME